MHAGEDTRCIYVPTLKQDVGGAQSIRRLAKSSEHIPSSRTSTDATCTPILENKKGHLAAEVASEKPQGDQQDSDQEAVEEKNQGLKEGQAGSAKHAEIVATIDAAVIPKTT